MPSNDDEEKYLRDRGSYPPRDIEYRDRVEHRLGLIEQAIAAMAAEIRADRKAIIQTVRRHQVLLDGDGESHQGIRLRLDRLEQAEERRAKWFWAGVSAAFAGLLTSLGALGHLIFGGRQ